MAGNRPDSTRAVTPDRLPPAQSDGPATAGRQLHPMLQLQRSAGNRATAAFVGEGGAVQLQPAESGGELMGQRSIGAWFRKKLGMKPKVSAPKGGHAMLPAEQGGVPSARELMEIMERGGAPGSSLSDESVEGVGNMFGKAERDNEIRDERRARKGINP